MEWLEGEDLSQRLGREGLTVGESVALALRVAEALGFAHARGAAEGEGRGHHWPEQREHGRQL